MAVTKAIPAKESSATGTEARLCTKGSFSVRSMWMTSVWVHMDSTNHPVWNRATYSAWAAGSVSWVYSWPPVARGHTTKYSSR